MVLQRVNRAYGIDERDLNLGMPPELFELWRDDISVNLGVAIVALIAAGKRVGVCATSHKAVNNLLGEVVQAADEMGVRFRGCRKSGWPAAAFGGVRVGRL